MNWDKGILPPLPLDGPSVKQIEEALGLSSSKSIILKINNENYLLTREGCWFKFSLLTKKNTVKRSTILQTLTELYNHCVHGHSWRIQQPAV